LAGEVTMDGVDLRQMDVGDVRRLIGVVTQETVLF
jgi:ABC-type multidrug transport system fused ATPase/permease subunit